MSGSRYIPNNNTEFCAWSKAMLIYALANHERWGVEAPDPALSGKLQRLETLANLCTTSKRTAEDLVERNTLRREVEYEVRSYLQGMIMRNKHVNDVDRTTMGLPLRDRKLTPVGEPEGQAMADISYPARTQLMLRLRHVEGTPHDTRACYGYRIYFGVFPSANPLPATKDLSESIFTRQKRELFTFDPEDSAKVAVFCIRYENNKGKPGPWGPMFSAVIP